MPRSDGKSRGARRLHFPCRDSILRSLFRAGQEKQKVEMEFCRF
jgi:hypothetical protein